MSSSLEGLLVVVLVGGLLLYFVVRLRAQGPGRPAIRPPAQAPEGALEPELVVGDPEARERLVELIPGKLSVSIFVHAMEAPEGKVACWTYTSDGLWPLGQKEIVFTVKKRPGEANSAYPRDLLRFYILVYRLAAEKRFVDVGGFSMLSPGASMLDRKGFEGVVYCPPQHLPGVRITAPSLTALVVTAGELAVAQQYGHVRLMSMIGKTYRYFPTAPWADRDRSEIVHPDEMEQSLLAKIPRATLHQASVRQESRLLSRTPHAGPGGLTDHSVKRGASRILLRLRPGAAAILQKVFAGLPPASPVCFLVAPDPTVDACLTWQPGQSEPSAICAPQASGASMAANFIAFVPEQEQDTGKMAEDGFVMLLRTATWVSFRDALEAEREFSIPSSGEGSPSLHIVWAPDMDPDYADPLESHVPGGWARFGDGGPSPSAFVGAVHVRSISLLTIQPIMGRRIEAPPLGDYAKAIEVAAQAHLEAVTGGAGQDMTIECEVLPDGSRTFRFGVRPEAGDPARGLEERLMEIPAPKVVGGPIRFQINLELWGGSKRAGAAAPS